MSRTAAVSSTDVVRATRLSLRRRVARIEELRARNFLETANPRPYSGKVEQPWLLIVVQRTHHAVLQGILQNPDRWPAHSAVMRDRRQRDRRVRMQQMTIERRRSQRRAEPDAMWFTHGFIVIKTPWLPLEGIRLDSTPA
jgi:hypothetical protein